MLRSVPMMKVMQSCKACVQCVLWRSESTTGPLPPRMMMYLRTHPGLCDPLPYSHVLTGFQEGEIGITICTETLNHVSWTNSLNFNCCHSEKLLASIVVFISKNTYNDWAWLSPSVGICHTLPVSAKELVTDSRTKRQHDIPGVDWWTWQVSRWSLLPSFECKLPDSLSCLSTPLEGWKYLLSSRTAYCHICTFYICDAVALGHTESICSTKMLSYHVFLHQFVFPHLKKKHGIWLISSHQNCIWHLNRGLGKSLETVSANPRFVSESSARTESTSHLPLVSLSTWTKKTNVVNLDGK